MKNERRFPITWEAGLFPAWPNDKLVCLPALGPQAIVKFSDVGQTIEPVDGTVRLLDWRIGRGAEQEIVNYKAMLGLIDRRMDGWAVDKKMIVWLVRGRYFSVATVCAWFIEVLCFDPYRELGSATNALMLGAIALWPSYAMTTD